MADALTRAEHSVATQRAWLREHGGNLSGYIARYGSADDPGHYGDGGEAIYAADLAAVERAEAALTALAQPVAPPPRR
jgi:hypothetical protein